MKFLRLLALFGITAFILSSCQKELDYNPAAPALGTLKAASSDCLPVTIYGTYRKDTLLNFSNTVDVQINVTQMGSYNIHTDTLNGYSFSATGYAGVLGISTIHLQAKGRPIAPQVDVFNVMFDTSHCQINIIVTGAGGGTPSTDSITADINGVHTTFNITDSAKYDPTAFTGYNTLTISGLKNALGDEDMGFAVGLPGSGTPVAGITYDVSQFPAFLVAGVYDNNITGDQFVVFPGFTSTPTPLFNVHITTISLTNVTGTFDGNIPDLAGVAPDLQVRNGKFSVTIYP